LHLLVDWDHFYPEFWVKKDVGSVQAKDIDVINGRLFEDEGNGGSDSGWVFVVDTVLGLVVHENYFGPIVVCNPPKQ
jgi:hypothetical protein